MIHGWKKFNFNIFQQIYTGSDFYSKALTSSLKSNFIRFYFIKKFSGKFTLHTKLILFTYVTKINLRKLNLLNLFFTGLPLFLEIWKTGKSQRLIYFNFWKNIVSKIILFKLFTSKKYRLKFRKIFKVYHKELYTL